MSLPVVKARTWRAIARDKWGDGVLMSEKGARQTMVDWEMFVLSRSSTTPPQVPDGRGLLQEKYADCPWKLLISCVLMSRVSSASVKCKAIEGFFSKFPTPTAVLASKIRKFCTSRNPSFCITLFAWAGPPKLADS